MDERSFGLLCKRIVANYVNERLTDAKIAEHNVYIVWESKILQNNKAILSTDLPDGMMYEVTYNGDKNEIYFDAYKKWQNICISLNREKKNDGVPDCAEPERAESECAAETPEQK